ncbi:hypothetical protein COO60DRAFT_1286149 [Scenedesmus sp. NREL 46B-D3]|nr:hypothetical protein COO60DRAFT_1286149 [Scenedesmus sp. NREL 46B-D3]
MGISGNQARNCAKIIVIILQWSCYQASTGACNCTCSCWLHVVKLNLCVLGVCTHTVALVWVCMLLQQARSCVAVLSRCAQRLWRTFRQQPALVLACVQQGCVCSQIR